MSHLLHVSGDPGVQQQLQSLPVIPPGGFHRYEQVLRGERLHRPGGGASPRRRAYSSPLPGKFPEIRRENFPARRCSPRLHRVSAARVSDRKHQHPGHQQAGHRGDSSGTHGASGSGSGFPHCDTLDGFFHKVWKLHNISTEQTEVSASVRLSFCVWPPAVWLSLNSSSGKDRTTVNQWPVWALGVGGVALQRGGETLDEHPHGSRDWFQETSIPTS